MQKYLKRIGILLSAGLIAGPVLAQEAEDDVDAGQKKVEKKQSLLEAEKKVERKKKEDSDALVKGEFAFEKFETLGFTKQEQELQFQKSKKRKEIIAKTTELADKTTDRATLPDLYFRLAENWWEENHYDYLIERAEYNRTMDQWMKLPENRRPPKPAEPIENYSKSIDFYEKILREYPGYKRIDEVLYRLGKAALQQGKAMNNSAMSVNGVQYLNKLVQQHQASKYIPQAHLSLAEYFFESNKLTQAKMNYEKIVQNFANSPMYNYALYKLGWVYYNLREFRRTIDTFKQVVQKIGGTSNKGIIEFRDQALKDLVSAFAELDHGWPEAKEYFKATEGDAQMWKRLEKMAEIYVASDKDDNAIELFTHFIENHPTDLRCVDWHESIVDVRKKSTNFPDIEKAMRTFLAFSDDRTSPWVAAAKRAGAKGEEPLEKAAKMGENYLLYISNEYHQQAQKLEEQTKLAEKARPLYAIAAKDYQEFVRRFPQSKKACIVNFYYAEILYDQLKDYKASNDGYKAVLQRCPGGEFEEDAALGVIYSVEQLMAKEHAKWDAVKNQWVTDPTAPPLMTLAEETTTYKTKKDKKEELTEDQIKAAKVPQKRQELHPLEKDYVDAADTYVKLMFEAQARCRDKKKDCGKGKKVPEIMYVAASVYYDRGQYELASERFEKVYNFQPDNRVAEIAIKTIIDIHARHKEWAKIEEWARKMLARKSLVVFERKDLRKYVAVAVAEQAVELAEKKDFDGAHKKYDTILAEFKKEEPEMAATAMYNKAEIFRLQKEELKAIKQYEQVVKEFPKSKVGPEAMFNIGVLYESMTQFKEAADAFLNMAKFRDNADAAQALINAGAILNALQQYKDAAAAYEKFQTVAANLKGDDPRAAELKGLIGDAEMEKGHVLEKMGGDGMTKAAGVYAGITAKFGARPDLQVEALGRKAETLRLANDGKDAAKNRKDVIKSADAAVAAFAKPEAQKGRAAYYAAQAQFYKAEYDFDDFDGLTLKTVKKMSQLGPTLQKKAEALKKAEKTYMGVFDVAAAGGGRAYAAAAMYRIGLLYFKFKEDLFNAPVPAQVAANPDLEAEYRQVVDRMAQPIEEQALAALRNAINVAHNLGVYNKWSKEAGDYAAKVSPEEYPTVEKDPNLPKATTAVSANKQTDVATTAAFVFNVRRGKYTVSYKPEEAKDAAKDAKTDKKDDKKADDKAPAGK